MIELCGMVYFHFAWMHTHKHKKTKTTYNREAYDTVLIILMPSLICTLMIDVMMCGVCTRTDAPVISDVCLHLTSTFDSLHSDLSESINNLMKLKDLQMKICWEIRG